MGRGLGVWFQSCVGETQGHNGQMAAGVSPGSGRSKKRPTVALLPLSRAQVLGLLRMLLRFRLLGRPCSPTWQVPDLHPRGAHCSSATPMRSQGAAAPTRHTALGLSTRSGFIPRKLCAADLGPAHGGLA